MFGVTKLFLVNNKKGKGANVPITFDQKSKQKIDRPLGKGEA